MTPRSEPPPETVPGLLAARSEATPDAVACHHRDPAGAWIPSTWRELAGDVRRVASSLRAAGVRKGDRVAVLGRTGREWFLTELAILSLGAVVVGIDPHASGDLQAFILEHSEARFLVADTRTNLEKVPAAARERVATGVWDGKAGFSPDAPVRAGRGAVDGGADGPTGADAATIVYTAGTTGTSKGVRYTHRHLLAAARAVREVYSQLGAGDTTVCWLPMAHLFQRMLNLVSIDGGMATYFVENPRWVGGALREVRPTFFAAVPRFYEKLAQNVRAAPDPVAAARDLTGGNVRFMLSGSAPLSRWVGEVLHAAGLLVLEAYGVTESAVPLAANRAGAYRFGSVGRPFAGSELRLADDGEVLVRGEGVFDGYYREEHRPAHLFTPDGFYRTGDLGAVDADGFWHLAGRKAEGIKTSAGRQIWPGRVEAVYAQSPYIDRVVVFGHGRAHPVALVALKAEAVARALGAAPDAADDSVRSPAARALIRGELERLGADLSAFEQVRQFDILPAPLSVEAGELTPTLKVRRGVIAERYSDRIERLYQESPNPLPAGVGGPGPEG